MAHHLRIELDDGGVVSFSVWETADEAERAIEVAAEWVKETRPTGSSSVISTREA